MKMRPEINNRYLADYLAPIIGRQIIGQSIIGAPLILKYELYAAAPSAGSTVWSLF